MAYGVHNYTLPSGRTELELHAPASWEQSLVDVGGNVAICVFEDDAAPTMTEVFHVVGSDDPLPPGVLEYVGSASIGGFGLRHVFRERG